MGQRERDIRLGKNTAPHPVVTERKVIVIIKKDTRYKHGGVEHKLMLVISKI